MGLFPNPLLLCLPHLLAWAIYEQIKTCCSHLKLHFKKLHFFLLFHTISFTISSKFYKSASMMSDIWKEIIRDKKSLQHFNSVLTNHRSFLNDKFTNKVCFKFTNFIYITHKTTSYSDSFAYRYTHKSEKKISLIWLSNK